MSQLNLKIVTPEKIIFEETADQVNVNTADGEIGILPNHENLMSKISPGELRIKKAGKVNVMAIGDGFLQIQSNNLTIMTDLAVDESDINEKALEDAKKRAEMALEQNSPMKNMQKQYPFWKNPLPNSGLKGATAPAEPVFTHG